MEVINQFNKELRSIAESKLPVSRHKISLITKSAMKALKFYKHVVQSVERFIARCHSAYKVPGLYVIDAIVRQSKHQYCDKDVFVPRFMRNIVTTFVHLSQCDSKDAPAIERVLRLWQQNGVFPTDLVEALLQIVYNASSEKNESIEKAGSIVMRLVNEWNVQKNKPKENIEIFMPPAELYNNSSSVVQEQTTQMQQQAKMEGGLIDSITKLLEKFHAETGQDVSTEINQIQSLHEKIVEQSAILAQGQMIDVDTLSQLHQSMEELTKKAAKAAAVQQSKLAILDDKDNNNENITDMEFVEQLQQMVDTLGQTRALQIELREAIESSNNTTVTIEKDQDTKATMGETSDTPAAAAVDDSEEIPDDEGDKEGIGGFVEDKDLRLQFNEVPNGVKKTGCNDVDLRGIIASPEKPQFEIDVMQLHGDDAILSPVLSNRSKSGSKSKKRKHSETSDKSPKKKDKKFKQEIQRSKYLPVLRKNYVSIISHTIFIGHLSKHVSETKLITLCEDFGPLLEFNMIPPRGCAFVTFEKRKSAYKAVSRLHEYKFESRELKVAWAPNKGVKDDNTLKEGWSESCGCTYVASDKFPVTRFNAIIEGGAELDEDSLTEELKLAIEQIKVAANSTSVDEDDQRKRGESVNDDMSLNNVSADIIMNPASAQFFVHFPPPPPPPTIPLPPPNLLAPHHARMPPPPHVLMAPRFPGPLPPPHMHPHFIHIHPHHIQPCPIPISNDNSKSDAGKDVGSKADAAFVNTTSSSQMNEKSVSVTSNNSQPIVSNASVVGKPEVSSVPLVVSSQQKLPFIVSNNVSLPLIRSNRPHLVYSKPPLPPRSFMRPHFMRHHHPIRHVTPSFQQKYPPPPQTALNNKTGSISSNSTSTDSSSDNTK